MVRPCRELNFHVAKLGGARRTTPNLLSLATPSASQLLVEGLQLVQSRPVGGVHRHLSDQLPACVQHNPAMQGTLGGGSELASVLEEGDEDDGDSHTSFSFFAPLPSDTLAATDTRYLPPKSRKVQTGWQSRLPTLQRCSQRW